MTPPPFIVEPLPTLITGALVLVRRHVPPWLSDSLTGSDALVSVDLLGLENFSPHSWTGQGGSACLRAVMISAAHRGMAAVMYMHDPSSTGTPVGTEPVAMTFAYAAHLSRVKSTRDAGWPWWRQEPIVKRLQVYDPARWACHFADVRMTDAERAYDFARIDDLHRFIADPTAIVHGVLSVK
jgi:hypothetical protein